MQKTIRFLIVAHLFFFMQPHAHGQLLWKITGKKLKNPSYLFGTIHITDQRVFKFSPEVTKALEQSDMFAGELNIDPSMMFDLMNYMFIPNDSTLKDLLSEAEYTFVKQKMTDKLGMMAPFADKIKPVFLTFLLIEGTMDAPKQNELVPLDLHLQQMASQKGKRTTGLETLSEQMSVFDKIPLKAQAEMLYNELKNLQEESVSQTERLIQLYTAQNLDSLYAYTIDELDKDMAKSMLTDRNERMAQRIEELIQLQSVFVAIGAAHLPGEDGLVALLRKKKLKVEPVY